MSAASAWAAAVDTAKAKEPGAFSSDDPETAGGWYKAIVCHGGGAIWLHEMRGSHNEHSICMPAKDALALARWINDTFGDEPAKDAAP